MGTRISTKRQAKRIRACLEVGKKLYDNGFSESAVWDMAVRAKTNRMRYNATVIWFGWINAFDNALRADVNWGDDI